MAIQVKTREEINNELQERKQALAVLNSKINDLASKLGIEPDVDKIKQEIDKINKQQEELRVKINNIVTKIEEADKTFNAVSEAPIEQTSFNNDYNDHDDFN